MRRAAWMFALTLGCSGKKTEPPAPAPAPPPVPSAPADAGITHLPGYDPSSGMHLDESGGGPRPSTAAGHQGRPIEITLRSTPSGAQVAVDGTVIGTTPAYWSGEADGRPHEFVFTLPHYALARYRFVPVTSGVVHARLEPVISSEDTDAGVPPGLPPNTAPTPSVVPAPAPVRIDAPPEPLVVPPADAAEPPTAPIGPQP